MPRSGQISRVVIGLLVAVAVIGGLVLALGANAFRTRLVYEVGPLEGAGPVTRDDLDRTAAALERRLSTLARCEVRTLGEDRIEIRLATEDPDTITKAKQLAVRSGSLEFAILAHENIDAEIVESARAEPGALVEFADEPVAQWFSARGDPGTHDGVVTRNRDLPGGGVVREFLVILDRPEQRITGKYLESVRADRDETGRPAISFSLSSEGGYWMQELTRNHTRTPERRRLGVIIDGRLQSAPTLIAVIERRGMITGIEEHELEPLVAALEAGKLSARMSDEPIVEERIESN